MLFKYQFGSARSRVKSDAASRRVVVLYCTNGIKERCIALVFVLFVEQLTSLRLSCLLISWCDGAR